MTVNDLRKEVGIELDLIETVLQELARLREDLTDREPTVREKTATAAFMAQFYGGVENILKRIIRFNGVPLPTGDTWHIDLFKSFCEPPLYHLPVLFDGSSALALAPYRKFRHVVYHGYGFQLDWNRMKEGLENINAVYSQFTDRCINN
jgi:hypothetical protein